MARPARSSPPLSSARPDARQSSWLGARLEALPRHLVAVMILLVAVAAWPTAQEAFRLPKLLVFSLLGPLALAALAARRARHRFDLRSVIGAPAAKIALPFAVLCLAGLATSSHPAHVRETLPAVLLGLAILWGFSVGFRPEELEWSFRHLALPTVVLTGIALAQALDWFQPFRFLESHLGGRLDITSLAGNPGDLACFLLLPSLTAQWFAWQAWRDGQKRSAVAWTTMALVAIGGVAITQTISVVVGLIGGSWLLWLCLLPPRRVLLASAIALATLLGTVATVTPLRVRVAAKLADIASGDLNAVLTGRLDGWRAARLMLVEQPLTGVGLGAFGPAYSPARLALTADGVPFYERHVRASFSSAHSEPLQVAAELGWPGLAVLAWALWVVFAAVRTVARRDRGDGSLAIAGTVALALLSLTWFPFEVALSAVPALLLLAWIFARAAAPDAPEAAGDHAAPSAVGAAPTRSRTEASRTNMSGRSGLPVGLLVPLCLLAAAWGGRHQFDRLRTAVTLQQIELASRAVLARGEAPKAFFDVNLARLARAAEWDPANVGVPLNRGTQYLLSGRPEAAIAAYREALALDARPEVYLNLGRALMMGGRREEATAALDTAVKLSPPLADAREQILRQQRR